MFPTSKLLFFVLIVSTTTFALPTGAAEPSNHVLNTRQAPAVRKRPGWTPGVGKKIKDIFTGGKRELESELATRDFNDFINKIGSAPGKIRKWKNRNGGKREVLELELEARDPAMKDFGAARKAIAGAKKIFGREPEREIASRGFGDFVSKVGSAAGRPATGKIADAAKRAKGKRDTIELEARQKVASKRPNVRPKFQRTRPVAGKRALVNEIQLEARQKAGKKASAKKTLGPVADAAKAFFPGAGGNKRNLLEETELDARALSSMPISAPTGPRIGPITRGPGGKAGKKRDLELELDARAPPLPVTKGVLHRGAGKPATGIRRELSSEDLEARAGPTNPAGVVSDPTLGKLGRAKKGKMGGCVQVQ